MRAAPNPDPSPVPDDEIVQATANAWWTPTTARLLDQIDPEHQPDADPAPGR